MLQNTEAARVSLVEISRAPRVSSLAREADSSLAPPRVLDLSRHSVVLTYVDDDVRLAFRYSQCFVTGEQGLYGS